MLKSPKTTTLADGLIQRISSMLDEIEQKTMTLTENSSVVTNDTYRPLRNIHTTRSSCRDALPCMNMALKLPQYFYLLMEKPLGCYIQVWSPYYLATDTV